MKRREEIGLILQTIDSIGNTINWLEGQRADLERMIHELRLDREILIKVLPRTDRIDSLFKEDEFYKREREKEPPPSETDGGAST